MAIALTKNDALQAHARDELGLHDLQRARPIVAAVSSAISFVGGALLPVLAVALAPAGFAVTTTVVTALLTLAALGAVSAAAGGAPLVKPTARVVFWGALAMAATFAVGALFGVSVA